MDTNDVAAALERARTALTRRPDMGLHDDSVATARWERGVRVVSSHDNGTCVQTDMPAELGGTGDRVTPGWMFRAGLAACSATTIAMRAAAEGVELTALEVKVTSRTDARGLLGMSDQGAQVFAGPGEMRMHVKIAASNADAGRLRGLVEAANRCAPISNAVNNVTPVAVHVEVES